jgi:hypothetical protein
MHAQVKCVRHSKKKNKKEIPADEPQTHTLIGWILNTYTTITANTPYTDKPATIIQIQNSLTIFVSFFFVRLTTLRHVGLLGSLPFKDAQSSSSLRNGRQLVDGAGRNGQKSLKTEIK